MVFAEIRPGWYIVLCVLFSCHCLGGEKKNMIFLLARLKKLIKDAISVETTNVLASHQIKLSI